MIMTLRKALVVVAQYHEEINKIKQKRKWDINFIHLSFFCFLKITITTKEFKLKSINIYKKFIIHFFNTINYK